MDRFFSLLTFVMVAVASSAQITTGSCYVIGEVNGQGWRPSVGVEMTKVNDGVFTATVDVEGSFGFACNLAGDWDTLNSQRLYPADGVADIALEDGRAVVGIAFERVRNDAWDLGTAMERVKLTVDYNDMTLSVDANPEEILEDEVYVVGDLSGWGFEPAYAMTKIADNVYEIKNLVVMGGFKLADSSWSPVNVGGAKAVDPSTGVVSTTYPSLGVPFVAVNGDSSLKMVINNESETTFVVDITLVVNGDSAVVVINGESGVDAVGADSETDPEYFNLQGVKVVDPVHGHFIMKRGGTVSKIMVK